MGLSLVSLFSGSTGNATCICSEKTHILVDAGIAGRRISDALAQCGVAPASLNAIVITHEHIDHVRSVGVLARKLQIPIYANALTWQRMASVIGPIPHHLVREFQTGQDFYIQDIDVQPFSIPHDSADPVGFCFYSAGRKVAVATDLGYVPQSILKVLEDSQALLLESNHDVHMLQRGHYPQALKRRILSRKGHLSNADAAQAIVELAKRNVRQVLLGHLSQENNLPELAYDTSHRTLLEHGIIPGKDLLVEMTYRDRPAFPVQVI